MNASHVCATIYCIGNCNNACYGRKTMKLKARTNSKYKEFEYDFQKHVICKPTFLKVMHFMSFCKRNIDIFFAEYEDF